MIGKVFESIKQGLTEAIGHAKGTQAGVKVWRPAAVDVAAVQGRLGFTQAQFAARFGVSVATLRHWERGDRNPQGPALVLLNLIDRDPATPRACCGHCPEGHLNSRETPPFMAGGR